MHADPADKHGPIPGSVAPSVRLTFGQWAIRLSEHLPIPFIAAHRDALIALWADGATVRQAAIYCRAFRLGPRLVTLDEESAADAVIREALAIYT